MIRRGHAVARDLSTYHAMCCYGPTEEALKACIDCCNKHYPESVILVDQVKQYPKEKGTQYQFKVPLYLPRGYKHNCPADKPCEYKEKPPAMKAFIVNDKRHKYRAQVVEEEMSFDALHRWQIQSALNGRWQPVTDTNFRAGRIYRRDI